MSWINKYIKPLPSFKFSTKTGDDLVEVDVRYEWDVDYAIVKSVTWHGLDVRPVLAPEQVEALQTEAEVHYYEGRVAEWKEAA